MKRLIALATFVVCCAVLPNLATAQTPTRKLAAGVLKTIPPDVVAKETFTGPLPLVEVQANVDGVEYDPHYSPKTKTIAERSKGVVLRRSIWNLEFSFKPVRMIRVDVPQPSGVMEKKLVWYMIFKVKNTGQHLVLKEEKIVTDEAFKLEHLLYAAEDVSAKEDATKGILRDRTVTGSEVTWKDNIAIRFFPQFVLKANEFDKEYVGRFMPAALPAIKLREFGEQKDFVLHDTISITKQPIPLSDEKNDRSVWGVVTWMDVDPRIDYFSVYVRGLTNAQKIEELPGAYKKDAPPGSGRKYTPKILQLLFWRPGDTLEPDEEEIKYGCRLVDDPAKQAEILKLFGIEKPLDYQWIYR